jgi:hypothetical protein
MSSPVAPQQLMQRYANLGLVGVSARAIRVQGKRLDQILKDRPGDLEYRPLSTSRDKGNTQCTKTKIRHRGI